MGVFVLEGKLWSRLSSHFDIVRRADGPKLPLFVRPLRKIFILAEKMVECEDEKELCYALILPWMAMAAMAMAELRQ